MTPATETHTRMETVMTEFASMLILNNAPDTIERQGQSPEAAAQMRVDSGGEVSTRSIGDQSFFDPIRAILTLGADTKQSTILEGATS